MRASVKAPQWLRDPGAPSLLLFAGLVVAGLVAIFLGWRIVAATLNVAYQLPAVVSGAMGGLALVLIGTVLLGVQTGRRLAATERHHTEAVLAEVAALIEALERRP